MKECTCLRCIMACVRAPGRLLPDDVDPIADYLGINTPLLVAEYLEDGGRETWRPRLTPDGCVFLKDQRCTIHAVKPYECREAMHDLSLAAVAQIEDEIAAAWERYIHG